MGRKGTRIIFSFRLRRRAGGCYRRSMRCRWEEEEEEEAEAEAEAEEEERLGWEMWGRRRMVRVRAARKEKIGQKPRAVLVGLESKRGGGWIQRKNTTRI